MLASDGPVPFPGRCGLAETDLAVLGAAVVASWDAFLDVVRHPGTDLTRPSRLSGWSGADTCIHLGSWDDHEVLVGVVESARRGGAGDEPTPDADNDDLVAAHRDASPEQVVEALQRSRDTIAAWFDSAEPAEVGRARSRSAVGTLPVLSLVHAGCYELAVHAMDLAPCGAPRPSQHLLDRGLAALIDVTGALSARSQVHIALTASTADGGWRFTSGADGWTTAPAPSRFDGTGVRGTAADLLDASAGRQNLGQLLLTRRLIVQQLPSFMRLAPLLHDVPGLPGGAALKTAVAGLGSVTKVLGRFRLR